MDRSNSTQVISPPELAYAPGRRRFSALRRWVGPGSVWFVVLLALLTAAAGWGAWKFYLWRDRKAFEANGIVSGVWINFMHSPTRGGLRHLGRMAGTYNLNLSWPTAETPAAAEAFARVRLDNVVQIQLGPYVDAAALLAVLDRPDCRVRALRTLGLHRTHLADAGIKELARPDSGCKGIVILYLNETDVTDAGLKELARPDSGLRALARLDLTRTSVTDAGVKELARPDCGLKGLTSLDLFGTKVTDAGLKELARPECGLKALTEVVVLDTRVPRAAAEELRKARPGLTVIGGY
jgi:hypothetical protein